MIWGLLSGLGLGEQLFAAGLMVVVAWYLLKGLSLAGTVGVAISSAMMYAIVTAVAFALALGLGWLDPQVDAIQQTISGVRGIVEDVVAGWLADRLSEVAS